MALIFIRPTEVTLPPAAGFNYKTWYHANKSRLSEKRARRYREDTGYRTAALQRSRQQRVRKPDPVIPDGHTIAFTEMATRIGITVWVLREWRRKNYFPEPYHRDGRLWFTAAQEGLLLRLQTFFSTQGVRVKASNKAALDDLTSLIYSNW